jgi:hypothetical protein
VAVVAVVDEGRELRAPQGSPSAMALREQRAPLEQLHLRARGVTGGKIRKRGRQDHGLREGATAARVVH